MVAWEFRNEWDGKCEMECWEDSDFFDYLDGNQCDLEVIKCT